MKKYVYIILLAVFFMFKPVPQVLAAGNIRKCGIAKCQGTTYNKIRREGKECNDKKETGTKSGYSSKKLLE